MTTWRPPPMTVAMFLSSLLQTIRRLVENHRFFPCSSAFPAALADPSSCAQGSRKSRTAAAANPEASYQCGHTGIRTRQGTTGTFASMQARTNSWPGSLMEGMPASLTWAIDCPPSSFPTNCGMRSWVLCCGSRDLGRIHFEMRQKLPRIARILSARS